MKLHRIGHMKERPCVNVGAWVMRGQKIGLCGNSGESSGPHAHYDIFSSKDRGWSFYVYGWPKGKVAKEFHDPSPYIKNNIPMANTYPKNGYSYLQRVVSKSGVYYHTGIDINGVNDYGAEIKSPVEGRVVFVSEPTKFDRVWKKYFGWVPWCKGWGNMVVIEEKPGFLI